MSVESKTSLMFEVDNEAELTYNKLFQDLQETFHGEYTFIEKADYTVCVVSCVSNTPFIVEFFERNVDYLRKEFFYDNDSIVLGIEIGEYGDQNVYKLIETSEKIDNTSIANGKEVHNPLIWEIIKVKIS